MKQSFQWWCPDVVVITSNISPWNWYHYNDRDYERQALFRRLKTGGVYKFEKMKKRNQHLLKLILKISLLSVKLHSKLLVNESSLQWKNTFSTKWLFCADNNL